MTGHRFPEVRKLPIRCDECGDEMSSPGLCRGCRYFARVMQLEVAILRVLRMPDLEKVRAALRDALGAEALADYESPPTSSRSTKERAR